MIELWLQAIGVVSLGVIVAKGIERWDAYLDRRQDSRRRNRPWRLEHVSQRRA